ncbi:MAG: helix-turn-helix transcriptional regulator [Sandaracinaceae bacterium]|nr:helix-turn-helix transcriptional regulator [Sandaracinaceae bacterium]
MAERRRKPERRAQYRTATYRTIVVRIGMNVHELRLARGWTQEEAAHRCEMSTRLFQLVEAGESNLTLTTLARLCDGLDVDLARLARPAKAARG